MKRPTNWEWELRYLGQGHRSIVGLDEVGRGAWAGPIVAAAYSFHIIPSAMTLFDSKALTITQRQDLHSQLVAAGSFGLGQASAAEIDELGLTAAQEMAYRRALEAIAIFPDIVLLDGRPWPSCPFPCEAVIDGDETIASIAAAAIIAKVDRDTLMRTRLHPRYPQYGFNRHVGYGTKSHREALERHGPSIIHRRSYQPLRSQIFGMIGNRG